MKQIFLIFIIVFFVGNSVTSAHEYFVKAIMGPKIKPAVLELFASNIEAVEEFYRTVLQRVPLRAPQTAKLNQNLDSLKRLEHDFRSLDNDDLKQALDDFLSQHYLKASFTYRLTLLPTDPARGVLIGKASENCAEKCRAATEKFSGAVLVAWNEFYRSLTPAALEANAEYEAVNEEVQKLFKLEQQRRPSGVLNTIELFL